MKKMKRKRKRREVENGGKQQAIAMVALTDPIFIYI